MSHLLCDGEQISDFIAKGDESRPFQNTLSDPYDSAYSPKNMSLAWFRILFCTAEFH